MPSPNGNQYLSRPLTDYWQMLQQDEQVFAASAVPVLPVGQQAATYYVVAAGQLNHDGLQKRAPGSEAVKWEFSVSSDTYKAERYAAKKGITEDDLANFRDTGFDIDQSTVRFLANMGRIRREMLFAQYMTTSIWTDWTGVAGTPSTNEFKAWNDAASDPMKDMRKIRRQFVERNFGIAPNVVALAPDVLDVLEDHPDFLERIAGAATSANPALVTLQLIAQAFKVERVLPMEAVYNAAVKTVPAVSTPARFLSNKVWLGHLEQPGPGVATALTTFAWRGLDGQYGNAGAAVYRLPYDPKTKMYEIEAEMAVDTKVTAATLGTLLSSVLV